MKFKIIFFLFLFSLCSEGGIHTTFDPMGILPPSPSYPPKIWFTCDDNSENNTVVDSSFIPENGEIYSKTYTSSMSIQGKKDSALQLGLVDWIVTGNRAATIGSSANWTISFWMKTDNGGTAEMFGGFDGANGYANVCYYNAGNATIGWFDGEKFNSGNPFTWEAETWYFFVFVHDGVSYKLYIDNNLHLSFTGPNQMTWEYFIFGSAHDDTGTLRSVDDFKMFDYSLTENQINTIYSSY